MVDDDITAETRIGQAVGTTCIDCGNPCLSIPEWPTPRCEECAIRFYGVLRPVDRLAAFHVKPPSADIQRNTKTRGAPPKGGTPRGRRKT